VKRESERRTSLESSNFDTFRRRDGTELALNIVVAQAGFAASSSAPQSLMPNIASLLKAEISRVARKEVRGETLALKKAVAGHRREIAALKRRARALEQLVRRQSNAAPGAAAQMQSGQTTPNLVRFSAKGLRSQRARLGLSAAEVGLLLGATAQSVYNWEHGKARPSARHMPAVAALRALGRKQAAAVVASRKG
jgi:DNA-binding transcriptional regulator YiaG